MNLDLDEIWTEQATVAVDRLITEVGVPRDEAETLVGFMVSVGQKVCAQIRPDIDQLKAERDAALDEVERLRQLYADHRKVIEAQRVQIGRLSLLPVTCTLCGAWVEGVRCPDGCTPKIITGEEKADD